MKKIVPIISIGMLLLSGLGVNASIENVSSLIPSSSSDEYDMVIIAPELFSDTLQPLINHKYSVGVQTFLKTTEEIYKEYPGRDQAEQIKYYIKNIFDDWDIKHVLLIGGKEIIPVRYVELYSSYWGSLQDNSINRYLNKNHILQTAVSIGIITDLYFADIYDKKMDFCSWDSNNNSLFGEMNDNDLIDQVDLLPEINVGRLLCKNNTEV